MKRAVRWLVHAATFVSALAWLALGVAWGRSIFAGDMVEWREVSEADGEWKGKEWTVYSGGGAVMLSRAEYEKRGVFAEMMKVSEQARFKRTRWDAAAPGMGDIDAWRIRPLGIAWGSRESVTRAPESEDRSVTRRWRLIVAYGPVWAATMILPAWWCAKGLRRRGEDEIGAEEIAGSE